MIDFSATKNAISGYRDRILLDFGLEDQNSAIMHRVCDEVERGVLQRFAESDVDLFSRNFIAWTEARDLLRLT